MEKNLTNSVPSVAATARKLVRRKSQTREIVENCLGLVGVLILLTAVFGFSTAHFFSLTTFTSLANEIPASVLMAVGMTFVLIIAGIDLSVRSVLAVSGGVLGVAMVQWLASMDRYGCQRPRWRFLRFNQRCLDRALSIAFIYRHSWPIGGGSGRSLFGYQFANSIHRGRQFTPPSPIFIS